ncbi:hypothetical protein BGZ96_012510 [Linnemannia gamsii]|uniref:WD40 repeat-like protein n=1 Tax=Linnemannia gamsii TaxID=64522 RepID=A0ABQ7KDG1_9FUNG|nr:hypothetical protein BGZ96_012510 [Linnemannia gamsii]
MTTSKHDTSSANSSPATTPPITQSAPTSVKRPSTKEVSCSEVRVKDRTVPTLFARQFGPGNVLHHKDDLPWLFIFPQNVTVPSPLVSLPPPGARLETTAQLAYCNHLLLAHLSPSLIAASITPPQDPAQQATIASILQSKEEQGYIREMTIRVIEEFVAVNVKTPEVIAEVILLGPYLDQEYHRKLLNCIIAELETARLLDVDLLQGLVQLVECAQLNYLLPEDLARILVVLRTRLQDTYQQSTKHPYYLTLALSHLLDVMVEGKVQDLRRVVDHEPLSQILGHLANNSDPYLKHQAACALQGLLHVPNDEIRRQFMLQQAGSITMGLLGVASVCKLDQGEFRDGVKHLYMAAGDAHEVATRIDGGVESLLGSGQDVVVSVKGHVVSGERQLWYSALREAQEHIRNGRLADFNYLVFEAPCHREIRFQWGVCLLLGEMAADQQWKDTTRHHATDLLAELYKNDAIWASNGEIDRLILHIIRQVVNLPESAISDFADSALQGLEKEGTTAKQVLYRDIMASPLSPYSATVRLSAPPSSPLLARVLAVPDVEYDIQKLRTQRLKERENVLYIPPQAKPTLRSPDNTLFPLMESALEFLASPGQVLLLLGDSGGGKSTFNLQLEHTLWREYKRGGPIPLYISLPAIDNPQNEMIDKQLRRLFLFSEVQIQELRQNRQFIVICDGYDESHLWKNLYTTNQLNKPGQWMVKVVISCRTQYLGSDYRSRFEPTVDRYAHTTVDFFQEVVLAPFSRSQIEQYVEQYVQLVLLQVSTSSQQVWSVNDYMDKLVKIPNLIDLVSNPFLLTLALRALPNVVRSNQDISLVRLTRVGLYESFTKEWLEINKRRLEDSSLSPQARSIFDILRDEGFVQVGINYQKELATAIFQHQDGNPIVKYSHLRDRYTWKAPFFSPDTQTTILREVSPLTRSGNQFRFLHRSILEYLYSRVISDPYNPYQDPEESESAADKSRKSFVGHPLNQRSIVREPSILQFLAEHTVLDPLFKSRLFDAVEDSKSDATVSQAAANAISVLVRAGVRFNGADLRGVRIPGADLRGGQFDCALLDGADLSNVNFTKTWMRQATLNRTQMTGALFGQSPYFRLEGEVLCCVFSTDGGLLVVSCNINRVHIFNTTTWTRIAKYSGGGAIAISPATGELAKSGQDKNTVEVGDILTGKVRLKLVGHGYKVTCIAYSSDGSQIVTSSKGTTLRIWSTSFGNTLHTLNGHHKSVNGVAFSPTKSQLVSCSDDTTLRIWNSQSGELVNVLRGHLYGVVYVAYSTNGYQIASGARDGGVGLWDANTGENHQMLSHSGPVRSLTYSTDNRQVVSVDNQGIHVWDARNGVRIKTLSGELSRFTSVVYSPTDDCFASGSGDGTVRVWGAGGTLLNEFSGEHLGRWTCVALSPSVSKHAVTGNADGTIHLWETSTGKLLSILDGSKEAIYAVAFSPCGQRIASVSSGNTVLLRCAQTGDYQHVFEGHTGRGVTVAFSPSGHQIVSAGQDTTVRTWSCETGEVGFIMNGHSDQVNNVVYSPAGHQIASCSQDKTVRLWCTLTGGQLFVLNLSESVQRVMYSLHGQEVITLSGNGGVFKCWDPLSGRSRTWMELFQSTVGPSVDIQWSQGVNCTYLTTSGFKKVRVWKLIEKDYAFEIQLLWGLGKVELCMAEASLYGAVGLSRTELLSAEKHGAVIDRCL